MFVGARAVVVACALVLARAALDKKYNITIGYLPSLTGELRDRQGLTISGALTIALEELNNSTAILPDVKILLEWHDTKSDTVTATRLLTDMSCQGVVAFFGPEGRCETEAIIAQSRNLPMISYKCADYEASLVPNFVNLEPLGIKAMKSVMSLLRYYRWNKFSILYEESWKREAEALGLYATKNNMTVNHQQAVIDPSASWDENFWHQTINDTKNRTRIYVFLGSTSGLLNMMSAMESHHMFAQGEYMVIFVDKQNYMSKYNGLKYLEEPELMQYSCLNVTAKFIKRARSLLVVASSEPSNYEQFADQVRKYNQEEPFNFPEVLGIKKFVSIYAAYLYDSVKLYATALDDLIKEDTQKEKLNYDKLMRIVTNGSRIVDRVIKKTPFKSVSGLSIRLDEHGDSEGDFSVLAFKQAQFSARGVNCSHTMVPVGHFQQSDKEFPAYRVNPRLSIEWSDSVKPEDEPACGFFNEKCSEHNLKLNLYYLLHWLKV